VPLFSRVTAAVKSALDQAARAAGKGEGEVLRELLAEALAGRAADRSPRAEKDEQMLVRLERLEVRVEDIGVSTRAAVRLLAHWAAQSGAVRVSEDELLAELRSVGRDEWQQAVEEAPGEVGDDGEAVDEVGRVLE
jgi:hypothetical protein